jgi:DNA-binding NtrC family response regulator
MTYPWPGNVRELRNAIQRAARLATTPVIGPEDLPPRIRDAGRAGSLVAAAARRQLTLEDVERMSCSASIARRSTASSRNTGPTA